MALNPKKYFAQLVILLISVFGIHYLIQRAFMSTNGFDLKTLIEIYVFLTFLSAAHFFAIYWLFKKWPKYAGFIFTGLSLLKMAVSILYLLPFIFPSNSLSVTIAINFMIVYLVLLMYEVVFVAKSLGKNH